MYTKNIPLTGESLGSTQARIADNFLEIFDVQDVNHVSFNDSGAGKHKFMQMPEQPSAPTTAVNEAALYTKQGSNPSEATLFYRGESNGFEYQMTKPIAAQTAKFGTNSAYGTPPMGWTQTGGWTFLPGGMLFQYGFYGKSGAIGSSGQVQFPVSFTTGAFSIQMTLYRNSGNQTLNLDSSIPPTITTFNFLTSTSGSDGLFWTAIGK